MLKDCYNCLKGAKILLVEDDAGMAALMETPLTETKKLKRERKTIGIMIEMYCRDQHKNKTGHLCGECEHISRYAQGRIDSCPFKNDKPTCLKCPVHCYKQEEREQVRQIMRYSGPRMIKNHPVLAVLHLLDGVRRDLSGVLVSDKTSQVKRLK